MWHEELRWSHGRVYGRAGHPTCGKKVSDKLRAAIEARAKERIDYAVPTSEMRAALAAEGVALPDREALVELSREYNERLERERKLKNKQGFDWYSLFTEMDEDGEARTHIE